MADLGTIRPRRAAAYAEGRVEVREHARDAIKLAQNRGVRIGGCAWRVRVDAVYRDQRAAKERPLSRSDVGDTLLIVLKEKARGRE